MSIITVRFRVGIAALGLALLAGTGIAQTDPGQFWVDYRQAFADPAGFAKKRDLIRRYQKIILAAVNIQVFNVAMSWEAGNEEDAAQRVKLLEDLARMYDLVYRSKILEQRVEFAKSIDKEKGAILADANRRWSKWRNEHERFQKAPKKDLMQVEQLLADGTRIVELLEQAGEDYLLGDICGLLSTYHQLKEDWVAEAELLVKARKCFGRYKRAEWENWAALRLRKLEQEKGIKAAAGGGVVDPEEEAKEKKKERPEPKDLGVAKLKYKTDKGPLKFESPSWRSFGDHLLWMGVDLKKQTKDQESKMNWPLGEGSVVYWEGGSKVFLDVDNDGKRPRRIKAVAGSLKSIDVPVKYADGKGKYRLVVRALGQSENFMGGEFNYSAKDSLFLRFARACHMEGTFNGVKFALVDDGEINARYNDFGQDMIKIGRELPQPLSPVMNFAGTLVTIASVKPDGKEIQFKEFVGDTGKLQVKWTGGKGVIPQFLTFKCTRGEFQDTYFNLAGGHPLTVPNGYYQFQGGVLILGKGKKVNFAIVAQGKAEVFEVEKGKTTVKQMGAPFDVFCSVRNSDKGLKMTGQDITIVGAMKEHYTHFYPDSFKPTVSVRIAGGAVIEKAKKLGHWSANEAIEKGGYNAMFFPKDLEFKGSLDKTYEVKVELTSRFLGKVKGNWNEARNVAE